MGRRGALGGEEHPGGGGGLAARAAARERRRGGDLHSSWWSGVGGEEVMGMMMHAQGWECTWSRVYKGEIGGWMDGAHRCQAQMPSTDAKHRWQTLHTTKHRCHQTYYAKNTHIPGKAAWVQKGQAP